MCHAQPAQPPTFFRLLRKWSIFLGGFQSPKGQVSSQDTARVTSAGLIQAFGRFWVSTCFDSFLYRQRFRKKSTHPAKAHGGGCCHISGRLHLFYLGTGLGCSGSLKLWVESCAGAEAPALAPEHQDSAVSTDAKEVVPCFCWIWSTVAALLINSVHSYACLWSIKCILIQYFPRDFTCVYIGLYIAYLWTYYILL